MCLGSGVNNQGRKQIWAEPQKRWTRFVARMIVEGNFCNE